MRVTEFNVGLWCMSENECIAAGINFAAYERGVSDAAQAFARSPRPTSPLLTDDDWQAVVDDRRCNLAFLGGGLKEAIEDRIRLRLALGVVTGGEGQR